MNKETHIKRLLLSELDRIAALPGNWDEKGGQTASPRATGYCRAFLTDIIPEYRLAYMPHLQHDGSISVSWKGRFQGAHARFSVVFGVRGDVAMSLNSEVVNHERTLPQMDTEALTSFVYAAN